MARNLSPPTPSDITTVRWNEVLATYSICARLRLIIGSLRPSCSRCQALRTECAYEAEEGESRWSALRRRNHILETERAEVRELISYLQSRPEPEAHEIFQRIRNGGYDDVFELLRQLREGGLPSLDRTFPGQPPAFLHHASSASSVGAEQRLPPIRAMVEVQGALAPPPISIPHIPGYSSGQDPASSRSMSVRSRGSQSSTDNSFDNQAS